MICVSHFSINFKSELLFIGYEKFNTMKARNEALAKLLAVEKQKNKILTAENVEAKIKLENIEIAFHSRDEFLPEISDQLTAALGFIAESEKCLRSIQTACQSKHKKPLVEDPLEGPSWLHDVTSQFVSSSEDDDTNLTESQPPNIVHENVSSISSGSADEQKDVMLEGKSSSIGRKQMTSNRTKRKVRKLYTITDSPQDLVIEVHNTSYSSYKSPITLRRNKNG